MSNARYFADGVDFYRTIYDRGTTEGPYTSIVSARRQLKRMTTPNRWGRIPESGGKIQKLEPVYMECSGNPPCFKGEAGSMCFMVHDLELKWLDVEE